jgi:hypothetical protein
MTEPQFTPPAHSTPTHIPSAMPHKNDSGLAVTSMVLGIVSIVSLTGFLLGIPAIVLGIIALNKKSGEKAMSIVGIATGAFSTLISILFIAFFVWAITTAPDPADSTPDPNAGWQTESEFNQPPQSNEI